MIPSTPKIIIIGAAIVFTPSIIVGLVVGHFFGFWLGVVAGGILLLLVVALFYRKFGKVVREQETKSRHK